MSHPLQVVLIYHRGRIKASKKPGGFFERRMYKRMHAQKA
jgi:hypothetical protein